MNRVTQQPFSRTSSLTKSNAIFPFFGHIALWPVSIKSIKHVCHKRYLCAGKRKILRACKTILQNLQKRGVRGVGGEGRDLSEGSQALKAAGHSCSKAALAPQGGEQQAVLGWVGLISPVGPPKLLDGFVS